MMKNPNRIFYLLDKIKEYSIEDFWGELHQKHPYLNNCFYNPSITMTCVYDAVAGVIKIKNIYNSIFIDKITRA